MKKIFFSIIYFSFMVLSFNLQAAMELEHFKFTAKNHAKGSRILVYCKQPVGFSAGIHDNLVTIKFNRAFDGNFADIMQKTSGLITRAQIAEDNKTIYLYLKEPGYNVNKFISDNFVGIDIIKTTKPSVSTNAIKEKKDIVEDEPLIVAELENLAHKKKHHNNKAKAAAVKAPVVPAPVVPVQLPDPNINNPDLGFIVSARDIPGGKRMIFPWQKNVAAAVFYRAGYLWLIFNENVVLNLDNIKTIFNKTVSEFSIFPNREYTILRLRGDDIDNVKTYKSGYSWVIEVMDKNKPKYITSSPIAQYQTPYSKGIFFPAEDMVLNPLTVTDPFVGDQLQIVPFYRGDVGVSDARNFIDFSLLTSSQGFVIMPISDQIRLTIIIPGIEILIPQENMSLSDLTNYKKNRGSDESATFDHVYSLLPFDKWQDVRPEDFQSTKLRLEDDILKAKDENKNNARLDLARFLLGTNYVREAQGVIKYIAMMDNNFVRTNDVKIIKGAIEFMLEHYDEAKDTFNSINTTSMKEEDRLEISTWQKAIEMIQGNASVGFDFIRFKERFLKTYLTPLYYQFAYLDLGDSIARNDLEHADEILRAIKITDKKDKKLLPYINDNIFYNGLYLQKNGDIDAAIKLWQTLADDKSDSRNRSRATFFIARTLYDAKRIKEDEAIDKINKARFAWRGDDTEFDMLNYLGDLYLKKKDYVDTLRIWKLIASSFAAKSDLLEITTRMSKLFFQIFGVGGEANAMNDLKAVALFYEFRELTPIGKMGDEIVQQLSYKLIKMDLLDRASALLNHQINFRLSGIDRVLIADKLALLYILNLKPNKALDTLDNTEDPSITPEIRAERSRIKAQALIALKQNDLALEAIQSDNGDEANMIRVNIAWDKSDWSKVIQLLSPVLDKKASLGNRFSAQDSEYVLRLALCNIMLNNQQGVKDIYNKYEKLMDNKTNLQATLDFIAKGDAPIDYTALEQTLGLTSMVGFMDQYRKTIISPTITSAQ